MDDEEELDDYLEEGKRWRDKRTAEFSKLPRRMKTKMAHYSNDDQDTSETGVADYDRVTLLQMGAGARLYEVRLYGQVGLSSKSYTYKSTFDLHAGDTVVAQVLSNAFNVGVVQREVAAPPKGVACKWIVHTLMPSALARYAGIDDEMKLKLEMGRAQREAQDYMETLGLTQTDIAMPGQITGPVADADEVIDEGDK